MEWDTLSWGLFWIVNSMPNFSKRRRQPIRLHQFNPYMKRPKPTERQRERSFNAIWDSLPETQP